MSKNNSTQMELKWKNKIIYYLLLKDKIYQETLLQILHVDNNHS